MLFYAAKRCATPAKCNDVDVRMVQSKQVRSLDMKILGTGDGLNLTRKHVVSTSITIQTRSRKTSGRFVKETAFNMSGIIRLPIHLEWISLT